MNIEEYRAYCLAKHGVTESTPFDEVTLVFKVVKMFALSNIEKFEFINLKCDPDRALELRVEFDGITPGYHMSKKHWNSVSLDGSVSDELIYELINHSYDRVCASLTKKQRADLDL